MRTLIIVLFSHKLKQMIKERAAILGLSLPEYLKYIAVKDIEEAQKDDVSFR